MDPTVASLLGALALTIVISLLALAFARVMAKPSADREQALLLALTEERELRARVEDERELERAEARKYRDEANARMASMERELKEVKAELAIVKQRAEIERATLLNVLRLKQGEHSGPDGFSSDLPEDEDARFISWIARHFRMEGDIELLAANAQFPVTVPSGGGADQRANWLVTWARQNGLSGNLSTAAKKMRPNVPTW